MSRRKGFTLVDLLAVAAVSTVLFGQIGALFRSRELARRASCKSNISAIGKALAIYTASYKDQWPWLISNNQWDTTPTGAGRLLEPGDKTAYNVTAICFQLVRDGQGPGIFVCPSTRDMPDPNTKWDQSGKMVYAWDFTPYADGNTEHISYSYQAPMLNDKKEWLSGVTSNSDSGLIVLSDRTPAYDGLRPDFDWTKKVPGDSNASSAGMSQNHTRGEMMNLLFADLHVGETRARADVGIEKDNIFSAAGKGKTASPWTSTRAPAR
jgi:prepilin-type processing-associated H-X9-DG protein